MSFNRFFGGTFALLAVLGYGLVFIGEKYMTATGIPAYISQTFIVMSVFLLVIAVLFLVIVRIVVRPIDNLITAMNISIQKNKRESVTLPRFAPKEMHALVLAFINLSERVEDAHKSTSGGTSIKSDFISTAAHQLRTPITGIRWALEALAQDINLNEEEKSLVKDAGSKSRALVSIINTLLNVSSIESGGYHYTFSSVDIEKLSQTTIQDLQYLAHEHGVTLEHKTSQDTLPVRADVGRIGWILSNVIENAIRYTPKGGRVTVCSEVVDGKKVLTHISDTGIGISPEDSPNIFQRFYRAGNAIAKENAGNGLGLYIARTIAVDHDGELSFSANANGKGTTFTLSLPTAS